MLVPVALGMAIAARRPGFAARMERPFKAFSAFVLAAFAFIAIAREWEALVSSAATLGGVVLVFNLVSLLSGYYLSRLAGLAQPLATAISYEIGIHNSTLAIYIALSVLGSSDIAVPPAIYSVLMFFTAAAFAWWATRAPRRGEAPGSA